MEKQTVTQPNLITEARYEMTALQKNIFYLLLTKLKIDEPFLHEYKLTIHDIKKIRNIRLRRDEAIKAAKGLISKGLTIYTKDQKEFLKIGILANASYKKDENKEYLVIKFDKKLYPFLCMVKSKFTTFNLLHALNLRSIYSKRMYEMLSQFKRTGIFRISVQDLRDRFELKDKYVKFGLFAKKVLEVAKEEILECTDISFTYTTKKTGKKITDLEFKINYKPSAESQNITSTLPEPKLATAITQPVSKTEYRYEKLPLEELRLYKRLQEELGLNNKALCLAVVKNIPSGKLERNINQFLEDTKFGKNTITASSYFKSLLNESTIIEKKGTLNKVMNPSKDEKAELIWNRCLDLIKNEVPQTTFKTWFMPIVGLKFENDTLTVQVPSEIVCEWVEEHYLQLLTQAITQEIGPAGKLEYVIPR